jgi:predicted nuclease of restriction endonuclease-like (RecB) superfamily
VSQESENDVPVSILGTVSQEFYSSKDENLDHYLVKIFTKIPYSHFVELIKIKDTTKRKFYELLIIKNTLSVRELTRQISALTYERVGLSREPVAAIDELENKIAPIIPTDAIKSLYFFDFFDLPSQNLIHESQLEEALINHLEQFILELGNGFCFEARQKRILIDDQYYFVDLVFYHRILKCHILIELKIDQFKHEHLSQLNSYVSAYRDQIMQPGDHPPIGILLCTEKGPKMVEYALAGLEEKLFVSKYLLKLPTSELLENFIENELNKI